MTEQTEQTRRALRAATRSAWLIRRANEWRALDTLAAGIGAERTVVALAELHALATYDVPTVEPAPSSLPRATYAAGRQSEAVTPTTLDHGAHGDPRATVEPRGTRTAASQTADPFATRRA